MIAALGRPGVAAMLALGFASGLPFLLTGGTLGFWLAKEGTSLAAIGFLSWVGLAYSLKYLWSPFIDRLPAPFLGRLGRRRGWVLLSQGLVGAGLVGMAVTGPHGPGGLVMFGVLALVVAFASATQDVAFDAWRIEAASDSDQLGLFTSAAQFGYRVAVWVTQALILIFAGGFGWPISYALMGLLMGVGVAAALLLPEPARADEALEDKSALWTPRGLLDAVVGPFLAFVREHRGLALLMLVMVGVYRMPEFLIGPIAGPFYLSLGLDVATIGTIRGSVGLASTMLGVAAGGLSAAALGYQRTLVLGALAQGLGVGGYSLLAVLGGSVGLFGAVLAFDDFCGAFGSVAFITYLSSLTSLGYTATQYALLSSLATTLGKIIKGFSGAAVEGLSHVVSPMQAYGIFYFGAGALCIPAVVLSLVIAARARRAAGAPAPAPA